MATKKVFTNFCFYCSLYTRILDSSSWNPLDSLMEPEVSTEPTLGNAALKININNQCITRLNVCCVIYHTASNVTNINCLYYRVPQK